MLRNLLSNVVARGCSRVAGFLLIVIALVGANVGQLHAAEINVGPGRNLKTLQAGISAAKAGDRIVLDAGTYIDEVATIDKPLTLEGAGRGAVLKITKPIANRKGILVVNADVTVRKITFEGAQVTDADGKNGAGIRHQAGRLTVDTCVFTNNQNGILSNNNKEAVISIRRSAFTGNGAGDGYTHAIYINTIANLTVTQSTFAGTKVGHSIKSRALKTTVTDTVLDDGVSGTSSYAIDLPNGGEVVLRRVRITQGQRTSNSSMIAYGAEKALHESSSLTVIGSTFINRAQNSTAINNFTPIAATLTGNSFQNVGEATKGPVRMNRGAAPSSIHEGAIFSSADPNARSYLRFHNTGRSHGSVDVNVFDSRDGRYLGTWTSPAIPPNAAPQFGIDVIEAALQLGPRPPSYTIEIAPALTGTFQHVLHRAESGVLTNLSTCSAGVTRAGSQLAGVHTSNLDSGYPATVVVQNSGPTSGAAQIGIYDARQGQRFGVYTTPEIPVDGEFVIPVGVMEKIAGVHPLPEMVHWVLNIENEFSGRLQQLVANQRAGVISDITTVCALDAEDAEREPIVSVGMVFPVQSDLQSILRFINTGVTAAPLHVTLYDAVTGSRVGSWESSAIQPNASRQYGIASIIPVAATEGAPRFYRIVVESGFSGYVQHLISHADDAALSNLSSCDGTTTASLSDVAMLRASTSEGSDLALIVLSNSGPAAASATLEVFDAADGHSLGDFTIAAVPAGGSTALTVIDVEAGIGLRPGSGIGFYNLRLREDFPGSLQYMLVNLRSGMVSDMTTACAVDPATYQ